MSVNRSTSNNINTSLSFFITKNVAAHPHNTGAAAASFKGGWAYAPSQHGKHCGIISGRFFAPFHGFMDTARVYFQNFRSVHASVFGWGGKFGHQAGQYVSATLQRKHVRVNN